MNEKNYIQFHFDSIVDFGIISTAPNSYLLRIFNPSCTQVPGRLFSPSDICKKTVPPLCIFQLVWVPMTSTQNIRVCFLSSNYTLFCKGPPFEERNFRLLGGFWHLSQIKFEEILPKLPRMQILRKLPSLLVRFTVPLVPPGGQKNFWRFLASISAQV